MNRPREYWFPAKRYGWGWGFPSVWQGWVVLLVYAVVIGTLLPFIAPSVPSLLFFILIVLVVLSLGCIMWLKGEPPRWRWGQDQGK